MYTAVMNPLSHLMLSWLAADSLATNRRERFALTMAGIIPDADGLGALVDLARHDPLMPFYNRWHHVLGHGLPFALLVGLGCMTAGKRRGRLFLGGFLIFHLHLLCDLIGSRGPDGPWTVPWLSPVSDYLTLSLSWQWALNGWQNITIGITALALIFYSSWRKGQTPLEFISLRMDAALSETLRQRFGNPQSVTRN